MKALFVALALTFGLLCASGSAKENGAEAPDPEKFEEYKAGAEKGDAEAQTNLGLCYANGIGVEKDAAEAVKWLRKAAAQDNARAQKQFGDFYLHGTGVEKDAAEAMKWLLKAAEQDNAMAQLILGECYINGHGVKKDASEGCAWLGLAVVKLPEAGDFRDSMVKEKLLSPEVISAAQKRTKELREQIDAKVKGN